MTENLRALIKFRDGLSFVYLEHAVIEREDRSVAAFTAQGRISIPAAGLGCVMLGPGTRITHAAVGVLADCGTSVLWIGDGGCRFYAAGLGKSRSSANLERQVRAWAEESSRMAIVRALYTLRFAEALSSTLTLQQIRGKEGARVRDAYQEASRQYGVKWDGRSYQRGDWTVADPINRALSAVNAALYGICHAGIVASGFLPGLGFIHVGKQLSFVYDVADLYKVEFAIPSAFAAVRDSPGSPEREARVRFRRLAHESHLLERVICDLGRLFGVPDLVARDVAEELPIELWDGSRGVVPGGVSHVGDLG